MRVREKCDLGFFVSLIRKVTQVSSLFTGKIKGYLQRLGRLKGRFTREGGQHHRFDFKYFKSKMTIAHRWEHTVLGFRWQVQVEDKNVVLANYTCCLKPRE